MKGHSQATCDRIRRLREVHTQEAVAAIMHMHPRVVQDIEGRGYEARTGGRPRRPVPSDFAIQCNRMSTLELARHYAAGQRVVQRWIAQTPREYVAKPSGRRQRVWPERAELEQALAQGGPIHAARVFGVSRTTIREWRKAYGLPFRRIRTLALVARATARVGWVERYVAERIAA